MVRIARANRAFLSLRREANGSTCRSTITSASWLLCAAVLAFCTQIAVANAQDLAVLQDSLQNIENPARLRQMLAQHSAASRPTSALALTERGFIGLRLFELTARRQDGKEAQKAFEEALRRDPNLGWAHYGLGLSLIGGPDANPFGGGLRNSFVLDDAIARVFGNDLPSKARRAFLKAVTAAPPVTRAADPLADLTLAKHDHKGLEESRAALRQMLAIGARATEAWLALARVETALGDVVAAENAVDRAVTLGAEPSAAAHTRALALFRADKDEAAAKAWLESVDALNEHTAALHYTDIWMLLTKQERAQWQDMDLSQQRDFLRSFWDLRAALAGIPLHDRIAEHYRRVALANARYPRTKRFGAPSGDALLLISNAEKPPFDDRGVIYVRHGEPLEITRTIHARYPNESWTYRNPDGSERTLHFFAFEEFAEKQDFTLAYTIPCDPEWAGDRLRIDPRLRRLTGSCDQLTRMSLSAELRQDAYELLATDSDAPDFNKDLPFFFDLYTFRAPAGRTSVVAAVAVPVEKINKSEVAANPAYRMDLSLILVDTLTKRVIRQDDSVALAATRAFKGDDLFRLHIEVAVPPSESTVQRVIVSDPSVPGVGQLYGGPFPVPDYSSDKLRLSDVVLAEPGVAGNWRRGAVALALVPTGRFRGGSFNVFYEVYNLPQNSRYSTEIQIEPVKKSPGQRLRGLFGGGTGIQLRFEGVATDVKDAVLQELRRVDVPLGEGRYRMRITLTNLDTGESAQRERLFTIPKD